MISARAFDPEQAGSDEHAERDTGRNVARRPVPGSGARLQGLHPIALRENTTAGARIHAIQFSINRRFKNGVAFGFNDAITLQDIAKVAPRYNHDASGQPVLRADQPQAQALLEDQRDPRHLMKATALWQLPTMKGATGGKRALAAIVNDWQLSSVWTGATGTPYQPHVLLPERRHQREPHRLPRLRGAHPDRRRWGRRLQQQPVRAVQRCGVPGAAGRRYSGSSRRTTIWLAVFQSALDLSLQREIPFGGSRRLQLRVDIFNAPNQAIVIPQNNTNGRVTTLTLSNPNDPATIVNNQFNADGSLNQTRARPQNAGFGAANAWQNPRTVQAYIRFKF